MLLKNEGFEIACETNGSLPIPEAIDFPTVSPKRYTQKKYPEYFIHDDALSKAKEFKYVVDDEFDFKILDRHSTNDSAVTAHSGVRYSLTPEYSKMKEHLPRIMEFIKAHPQWQLNLQTHKWIEIP
jgi:7-carboxy-7-deazaguanine synthase